MKEICIIASVYNEESGLEIFYETTVGVLRSLCTSGAGYDYRITFVNDGSTDNSSEVLARLLKANPDHVRVITFSRNFGHEAAMTAGLDYSEGDIFIFMDSDLQHPPELIPEIVDKFEHGFEIVSMARTKNTSAGRAKNLTSDLFYKLINEISETKFIPGASDFFAIGGNVAMVLRKNYRERVRFMRGIVQNIGFNRAVIEYEAAERLAGKSHYNFKKLWRLSMDTLICFSNLPLKLGIYAGLAAGIVGVVLLIYLLLARTGAASAASAAGGYTALIVMICFLCFMFAVLFVILGILGEYLGVLFREIKDRPIYIVKNIEGGEISASRDHQYGTTA